MGIDAQNSILQQQRYRLESLLNKQSQTIFSILPESEERAFWSVNQQNSIQFILLVCKPVFLFYLIFELISLPINYFSTLPEYRVADTVMTFIAYSAGWLILGSAYFLAKTPNWHKHYNLAMATAICIGLSIIQIAVLSVQTSSMIWRGSLVIVFAYMFCYLCSGVKNRHIFLSVLIASLITYGSLWHLKQDIHIWVLFNIMILGNCVGYCLSSLMISRERINFLQTKIIKINQKINDELRDHLFKLSHQDNLTLLGNRRSFEEILTREFNKAKNEQQALAVLFIDVDYFKLYNDHYGHQQGDLALIQVAQILLNYVENEDLAIRYGGEEFVILLTNTSKQKAFSIAEKILTDIRFKKIEHVASKIDKYLTVSIGISLYQGEEKIQKQHLLRTADIALYQAKNHGRDQMVFLLPQLKEFVDIKRFQNEKF